jgi:hypothetical protein
VPNLLVRSADESVLVAQQGGLWHQWQGWSCCITHTNWYFDIGATDHISYESWTGCLLMTSIRGVIVSTQLMVMVGKQIIHIGYSIFSPSVALNNFTISCMSRVRRNISYLFISLRLITMTLLSFIPSTFLSSREENTN